MNDIEVLEEFIKYFEAEAISRKYRRNISITVGEDDIQAIENLIKGYRELEYKYNKALTDLSIEAKRTNEENYRCSLFAVENNDLKEKLADSIPKSLIKEKIEELKAYKVNLLKKDYAEKQIELPNQNVLVCSAIRDIATTGKIQVLEELLNTKM